MRSRSSIALTRPAKGRSKPSRRAGSRSAFLTSSARTNLSNARCRVYDGGGKAVSPLTSRRLLAALTVAVLLPLAAAVAAQVSQQDPEWRPRIWVGGGGIGRFSREPPKWAKLENFDGSFNFCRAYFTADRFEAGGTGWSTDFPGADNNFSVRLGELTSVRVRLDKAGQPDYVVVRLTDPLLFHCPILHMEDVGVVRFSDDEVESLRTYLLKGGYLIVDDFWGTRAWDQWEYEIGRVLAPHQYPIKDIPHDHPIMNV